jgi:hypothetical protein
MLEVHAPHKRLREAGEYFIHLVIITIGLLIATQIESCVEWRAHKHIAAEAREALHKEIAGNLKTLRDAQPGLKQWRSQVNDGIAAMLSVIDHPNDPAAQPHSLSVGCSGITLDNTAWKTAESTGALDYMPYEEASTYVNIYQAQERLLAAESLPCADAAAVFGILSQYHLDANAPKLNRQDATAIANKLGEMRFHLGFGSAIFDENIELNAAFTEGRKPRTDFTATVQ